jgi:hypothetical protein
MIFPLASIEIERIGLGKGASAHTLSYANNMRYRPTFAAGFAFGCSLIILIYAFGL